MIHIHTLGGLSVRGDDGKPISGAAAQPRRMAVLALLARAGERGVSREKLISLFWPDLDAERGPRTLAQALYALRRDLGVEDAIAGAKELRLDPALVSTDIGQFMAAVSRGDDERAAALYGGAFLDGFHVPNAEDFSRWVDAERVAIARDYTRSLESLARAAVTRGDSVAAVEWWRKLAALEPLNARVAVGLMEALVNAGERAAAIRHAHVYELLVQEELDLPPDKEVLSLAERLRAGADAAVATPAPPAPLPPTAIVPPAPLDDAVFSPRVEPAVTTASSEPAHRANRASRWAIVGTTLVVIAAAAMLVVRSKRTSSAEPNDATLPLVAVGHVAGFGTDSAARTMAGPVSDLLATSLSRVSGLRVISQGRMLELMRVRDGARDTSSAGFIEAARQAGATQVIDGTLYALPAGRLRLDLRQVDVRSGAIGKAHIIEGNDLFALVDSGTARLVAALGRAAPPGSVTDVTTTSVMAYRMYAEGLRAYYRADYRSAMNLFDAALHEDSLFALAAYQGALATSAAGMDEWFDRMQRAKQLASRATERERLAITADWAFRVGAVSLRAIAETLTTRFPAEVGGHLALGVALLREGEFAASRAELQRAVTMDSAVIRSGQLPCAGCDALRSLVSVFILTDSLDAAERTARWWLKVQPTFVDATTTLLSVLDRQGRAAEVDSIFRAADLPYDVTFALRAAHLIRVRDYAAAEQMLDIQTNQTSGGGLRQLDAYWLLAISLREQGRLDRALDAARVLRRFPDLKRKPGGPHSSSVLEAQIELERGRPVAAAALFDTVARLPLIQSVTPPPRVWPLAQAFAARITAGDTSHAEGMIDSMRLLGAVTGSARDARFFHHLRGLLQASRGRDADAIEEFRAAVYSLTDGYTRTSYELARAYVRSGRPRDALTVLRPALHAALDGSALYVNRTELHELLAKAWEDAGVRDSAAANYALVARVWSAGDSPFKARAENARQRAASLSRRPPPA